MKTSGSELEGEHERPLALHTDDGGDSWLVQEIGDGVADGALTNVAVAGRTGIAAGFSVADGPPIVLVTENGVSWHSVTIPGARRVTSVAAVGSSGD